MKIKDNEKDIGKTTEAIPCGLICCCIWTPKLQADPETSSG